MSKIITISIDENSLRQFDEIVEIETSDRSKMVRKWIKEYRKKNGLGE
jgi:metal-responsive CopG/Arc/MetJ family transcriptional regulator